MAEEWFAYFDRLKDSPLHRAQSALYVRSLIVEVGVQRDQRVLDFGCGFGSAVALLAPLVAEVWWWDSSPNMRSATGRTTSNIHNVRLCDLSAPPPEPQRQADRKGGVFDLILVNSVAQYMAPAELWRWIEGWRNLLAPDGQIVLSDLIPHDHGPLSDIVDLFRFGAHHGSRFRAARLALGDGEYRRTSRAVPLVRVGAQDLIRHASDAGLETTVLPHNLTHFTKRWTAVLHRSP